VFAPPLIVILLLVCNNRTVFGDRCNGRLSNMLGWFTVVVMGAAASFLIWSLLTGKAM
jgi:Mn2+/Fe2+ NRAMP family transporter